MNSVQITFPEFNIPFDPKGELKVYSPIDGKMIGQLKTIESGGYCSADSLDIHLEIMTDIAKALKKIGIDVESMSKGN